MIEIKKCAARGNLSIRERATKRRPNWKKKKKERRNRKRDANLASRYSVFKAGRRATSRFSRLALGLSILRSLSFVEVSEICAEFSKVDLVSYTSARPYPSQRLCAKYENRKKKKETRYSRTFF